MRIANRALSDDEIALLKTEKLGKELNNDVVADWDFSTGIGTLSVSDISASQMHGEVVNTPLRAVYGLFADFATQNWQLNPAPLNAIHFHADDLYDAEWTTDFNYTIPADLKSGVYAARLTQGDFNEYITFFVAPPNGKPSAKLAYLMPDYTYLAYTNNMLGFIASDAFSGIAANWVDLNFLYKNREYIYGFYNTHLDATANTMASYLRPVLSLKPGWDAYNFTLDTHFLDWLSSQDIEVDIITDELLHHEGYELLKDYQCVISGAHPEYNSHAEWEGLEQYLDKGGRVMYMGANGWFWSVGPHPEATAGIEYRKNSLWSERTMENGARGGGFWESDRRLESLLGINMSGMVFMGCTDYQRLPDSGTARSKFIFEGVTEGRNFGAYGVDLQHPGAAGYEFDKADFDHGTPRHALILAKSNKIPGLIEETSMSSIALIITQSPWQREETITESNMVFFETNNGGAVFTTGSIARNGSLLHNDGDNDVARITGNVLRRFLNPAPFPPVHFGALKEVQRAAKDSYDNPAK